MHEQILYTQNNLLMKEQFDQSMYCLPFSVMQLEGLDTTE